MRSQLLRKRATQAPKNFWVVLENRTNTLSQLASGSLKGVYGISSSPEIIKIMVGEVGGGDNSFFLRMPGASTLEVNKGNLLQVDYRSTDQLLANNMSVLERISGYESTPPLISDIMSRILFPGENVPYATRALVQDAFDEIGHPRIDNILDLIAIVEPIGRIVTDNPKTHNEFVPGTPEEYKKRFEAYLAKEVDRPFGDEAEWLVQGGVLRIPDGSTLGLLLGDYFERDELLAEYKKWIERDDTHPMVVGPVMRSAFVKLDKLFEFKERVGDRFKVSIQMRGVIEQRSLKLDHEPDNRHRTRRKYQPAS